MTFTATVDLTIWIEAGLGMLAIMLGIYTVLCIVQGVRAIVRIIRS